jgi:hypothetical protein
MQWNYPYWREVKSGLSNDVICFAWCILGHFADSPVENEQGIHGWFMMDGSTSFYFSK